MRYTEEELDDLLDLLARSTGCAAVSDLIFWPAREMTAPRSLTLPWSVRPSLSGMEQLDRAVQRPNQAMQLTASMPAICASGVCRRERILRFMHIGLAAADLVSR